MADGRPLATSEPQCLRGFPAGATRVWGTDCVTGGHARQHEFPLVAGVRYALTDVRPRIAHKSWPLQCEVCRCQDERGGGQLDELAGPEPNSPPHKAARQSAKEPAAAVNPFAPNRPTMPHRP